MLPLLPAETTPTTPNWTMLLKNSLAVSSRCPKSPPTDMLMISTGLFKVPVLLGSRANSSPSSMAMPLHDDATELQTFTAYNCVPGAIPTCSPSLLLPPRMSDVWLPCPLISIGFASGAIGPLGHTSPTKSYPPTTFAVGKRLGGGVPEATATAAL